MKRVLVTGIGIASPVGNGRDEFWRNLSAGVSGIGPITLFDASSLPVRIGGQVNGIDEQRLVESFPEVASERDRKVLLGLTGAQEAMADAGLQDGRLLNATLHVGVSLEQFFLEDLTAAAGADDLSAAVVKIVVSQSDRPALQTPLDRLTQTIGDSYGLWGDRYTNCSACAAGAQVVGEAFRLLQNEEHDLALVGASDSMLNPLGLGGFSLLGVLSEENDHPQGACRPFDASRRGTVLGEGAAFLVLETLERAQGRGARAYAEILGYGSSMDAFRVSDPDPSGLGAVLSMRKAMDDAGLGPEDVDGINAHGTGTPKNDIVETVAIKETLGGRADKIPIHAVKSMTGHMIAASGAAEAIASVLTLVTGIVPPTINLTTPDPQCDLDYVREGARSFNGTTVMSNSFGFGGQNATLLFGRYEE